MSSGTGRNSAPRRSFSCAYDDSSLRKSAVQTHWISASTMPVRPKVTSSELNGVSAKRTISACSAAPSAKNSGTMIASVSSGSMPPTVESC